MKKSFIQKGKLIGICLISFPLYRLLYEVLDYLFITALLLHRPYQFKFFAFAIHCSSGCDWFFYCRGAFFILLKAATILISMRTTKVLFAVILWLFMLYDIVYLLSIGISNFFSIYRFEMRFYSQHPLNSLGDCLLHDKYFFIYCIAIVNIAVLVWRRKQLIQTIRNYWMQSL